MLDMSRFCFGSGFVVVQSQVFSMKYMCKRGTNTFVTSDDKLSTGVKVDIEVCHGIKNNKGNCDLSYN